MSSTSPPKPAVDASRQLPRVILHRAANLLTSNGQPILAVQEEVFGQGHTHHRKLSEGSIGASIKRSLSTVKNVPRGLGLTRSNSTSAPHVKPTPTKGHRRANSEHLLSRPVFHSSLGFTPADMDDVRSKHLPDRQTHPLREEHVPQPAPDSSSDEVKVPVLLLHGTPLLKVSAKKVQTRVFKLDPDQGQILWESKKSGVIAIESIKEIRAGADARNYREQFKIASDTEDRWITVIYLADGKYKTLHVVALAADVFQMWLDTLRHLYALRQELMSGVGNLERRQQAWERLYWKSADDRGDSKLAWPEVKKLCLRLNVHAPEEDLKQRFREADIHNRGWLDFKDFQRFVKLLKARPELKRIYNSIRGVGVFDFDAFSRFMRQCQKSDVSEVELEKIFHQFALIPPQSPALPANKGLPDAVSASPASFSTSLPLLSTDDTASQASSSDAPFVPPTPSPAPSPRSTQNSLPSEPSGPTLSLEGFTSFLLSAENSPFTDHHAKVWHDMTRPLSEYYISSSHNTYLVGHQLVGVSTIEGYIRALLHSCRSVELDIYDGDSGPVIFHGKTLTSKVSLREVCAAIAKYAFVASPYPIIISAEIHCSLTQQDQVADILKSTFGDALVTAPLEGRVATDILPSPEELRGRVLLKAKNLYIEETQALMDKAQTFETESSSTEHSTSDSEHLYKEHIIAEAREFKVELEQGLSRARSVLQRVRGQSSTSPGKGAVRRVSNTEPDRPKLKMSIALAALLVYTVGVKCRGFNKKEQYAVEHIFSLSEKTANKILKQSMMDLIKHNRTHVVRTYPKGLRLNSSNYDPHRYWAAGAQLVAINWQTFDLGYMINHAMFQRNGRVGYVLKPLALRSPDKTLLAHRTGYYFDVTIISAQQLPRAKDKEGREILTKHIVDPFVEVSILIPDWTHSPFQPGAPSSGYSSPAGPGAATFSSARTVTYRTGVVKNNGFNPVWEEALSIPFDCVGEMKDLIFVKFEVKEDDGEEHGPLAVYCSSLGSLEEGFRHLPLHDQQLSQYLFSTLFVQIQVRNVFPTNHNANSS